VGETKSERGSDFDLDVENLQAKTVEFFANDVPDAFDKATAYVNGFIDGLIK